MAGRFDAVVESLREWNFEYQMDYRNAIVVA
jgi:hypothetical protein